LDSGFIEVAHTYSTISIGIYRMKIGMAVSIVIKITRLRKIIIVSYGSYAQLKKKE